MRQSGPWHALPWGQGSVPLRGLLLHPKSAEMLKKTPAMDEVEDTSCTCHCFHCAAPGSHCLCWMGAGRWSQAFEGLEGVGWAAQKPSTARS